MPPTKRLPSDGPPFVKEWTVCLYNAEIMCF